jgi:Ca2+-binding RTX toxin-like protein
MLTCWNESALMAPMHLSANGIGINNPVLYDQPTFLALGNNVILWRATDYSGNTSEIQQTINVYFSPSVSCCPANSQLYQGSSASNFFSVNGEPACVLGYGGIDLLYSEGFADDYAWLGDGADMAYTRAGGSTIIGGNGNDFISFACDSFVWGGQGNDVLKCFDTGNAVVFGGSGNDTISTGGGNDKVSPGGGRDNINTNSGDDIVYIYDICELATGEKLNGGLGNDTLIIPKGTTTQQIQGIGVTATGFENVRELDPSYPGLASCN